MKCHVNYKEIGNKNGGGADHSLHAPNIKKVERKRQSQQVGNKQTVDKRKREKEERIRLPCLGLQRKIAGNKYDWLNENREEDADWLGKESGEKSDQPDEKKEHETD